MRKPLFIIGGINLALLVLMSLSSLSDVEEFFATMGILAFVLSMVNFGIGLLLLLISIGVPNLRPYGAACLIVSGLTLLSGFALCSQFQGHTGHM